MNWKFKLIKLNTKVSKLNMATRVAHSLEKYGIKTVGQLLKIRNQYDFEGFETYICQIRGLGSRSVNHINQVLRQSFIEYWRRS